MSTNDPDTRNVIDKYKGKSHERILSDLNKTRIPLEIAIENVEHDFNMGTIVRTANAFNVAKIHIIGSKQWNKRGAMKTDAYLDIFYYKSIEDFLKSAQNNNKKIIAVDIIEGAKDILKSDLPKNAVLCFGSEKSGLSDELIAATSSVVMIKQYGSTRSINVGVAAGIAMFEWVRRHHN